jgi:hypothetical protein
LTQVKVARRLRASTDASSPLLVSEHSMMDVVVLAIGFVFFAVSIAYVYACDQL